MKIMYTNPPETRKIVAVQGTCGDGIFLKNTKGRISFVNFHNIVADYSFTSLAEVLRDNSGRKPIYEGDEITIKFGKG
jgi:hypothetical protein